MTSSQRSPSLSHVYHNNKHNDKNTKLHQCSNIENKRHLRKHTWYQLVATAAAGGCRQTSMRSWGRWGNVWAGSPAAGSWRSWWPRGPGPEWRGQTPRCVRGSPHRTGGWWERSSTLLVSADQSHWDSTAGLSTAKHRQRWVKSESVCTSFRTL